MTVIINGQYQDLPEITGVHQGAVEINGGLFSIEGVRSKPELWRETAMARLAIAEYLDNLKPKLPTEPGSVIMLYKAKDWSISPNGMPVLLDKTKNWQSLSLDSGWIPPYDIEDWKPVQLTVVEVSS